jgi:hypothetical protein
VAAEGGDEGFVGGAGYCVVLCIGLSMSVVGNGGKTYVELILGRFEQVVLLTQGDDEVDFLGFVVADAEGFEFAGEVVLVDCTEGGE